MKKLLFLISLSAMFLASCSSSKTRTTSEANSQVSKSENKANNNSAPTPKVIDRRAMAAKKQQSKQLKTINNKALKAKKMK